jgi:hypothetical protein
MFPQLQIRPNRTSLAGFRGYLPQQKSMSQRKSMTRYEATEEKIDAPNFSLA